MSLYQTIGFLLMGFSLGVFYPPPKDGKISLKTLQVVWVCLIIGAFLILEDF